jgi:general secretion pathway protein A
MAIYESFYNLRREPFSLTPDPHFMYLTPNHREALAQLHYTVQSRKGFAVLTGEVGTGKTTLLRGLLESGPAGARFAYVFNPPRTRLELYSALAMEFGLDLKSADGQLFVQLQRFLVDSYRENRTVVAIFDEVQDLPRDVLEEIRLLTNLETASTKLLQVILAGQPEFDTTLDSHQLRALRQRVVLRYSLLPLALEETIQYIGTRLQIAGADRSPFDLSACRAVQRYSGGTPRLINLICDNALLVGYASGKRTIDVSIIESVAADVRLPDSDGRIPKAGKRSAGYEPMLPEASGRGRKIAVGFALAAFVLLIAVWAIL